MSDTLVCVYSVSDFKGHKINAFINSVLTGNNKICQHPSRPFKHIFSEIQLLDNTCNFLAMSSEICCAMSYIWSV